KLEFRPVLMADVSATSSASPSPSPSADPEAENGEEPAEGASDTGEGETEEPEATPSPSATPSASPTDASDPAWVTPELAEEFAAFTCDSIDEAVMAVAPSDQPLITCDDTNQFKYLLGPVEVSGEHIQDATAGLVASSTGVSTG